MHKRARSLAGRNQGWQVVTASSDPVAAVLEADAAGRTAVIFADIRATLGVEVVNLIWRHLATMPGALEWTWGELKPLYQGLALAHADDVRNRLPLPAVRAFSRDTLAAAGIVAADRASIGSILDSYHHTNALALVVFASLLARFNGGPRAETVVVEAPARDALSAPAPRPLPRLPPLSELAPPVARLVEELNGFGEDADFALVASMYRHLSHWPAYLALVRTLLAPFQANGELQLLVNGARRMAALHGGALAPLLSGSEPPPASIVDALAAVRRFVEHPIARMTGVCALIRHATPTSCPPRRKKAP
jgi:hypothetical protein